MKIKKILILTGMFLTNQMRSDFMPKQSEYPNYSYCLTNSIIDTTYTSMTKSESISDCLEIIIFPQGGEVLTSIKIDGVKRDDYLKQLNPPQNKPQFFKSSISLPKTTKTIEIAGSMGSTGSWINPNLPIPTNAVDYYIPLLVTFQG